MTRLVRARRPGVSMALGIQVRRSTTMALGIQVRWPARMSPMVFHVRRLVQLARSARLGEFWFVCVAYAVTVRCVLIVGILWKFKFIGMRFDVMCQALLLLYVLAFFFWFWLFDDGGSDVGKGVRGLRGQGRGR